MSKTIEVKPIDTNFVQEITDTSVSLYDTTRSVVIKDQGGYENAAEVSKQIKSVTKDITARRKAITGPLDVAKASVMDLFRLPLEKLSQAETIIKGAMGDYVELQENIRRKQQVKLEMRAKAEEDRKKKALEEQARKQEEKAAELRKQAEEANAEEKARLEAAAKKADEEAELRREKKEDVTVAAPLVASRVETPKGISYSIRWTAEVVDFKALPDTYKLSNMPMLNKTAQAQKGQVPIPGVKFNKEKIVASRAK